MGIGILLWIVVGIVAGFIAEKVMKGNHGLLTNLIVGLLGGVLGGFLFMNVLLIDLGSEIVNALVFATLGAIILLFLLRLVKRAA